MTNQVQTFSDSAFDELLSSDRPVLVDFYADWCGPCQAIAPIVRELASDYAAEIDVAKVDVDQSPELANQFGVRGIPTLILFKDGKPAETVVGAVSKSALVTAIDKHIA